MGAESAQVVDDAVDGGFAHVLEGGDGGDGAAVEDVLLDAIFVGGGEGREGHFLGGA